MNREDIRNGSGEGACGETEFRQDSLYFRSDVDVREANHFICPGAVADNFDSEKRARPLRRKHAANAVGRSASLEMSIRRLILPLLLFLLGGLPAAGQELQFFGTVVDAETGAPLSGAALSTFGTPAMQGLSDDGGFFRISTRVAEATFAVSRPGYVPRAAEITAGSEVRIALRPSDYTLGEVVIADRRPADTGLQSVSRSVLEGDLLRGNASARLGDVLSQIDGVTFVSTGSNIQLPVIHGLYGNRILVLNNGFRHGFQNWGSDHAPEIDAGGADRIKVIKGAAGVRYGPDALGGAVLIESNHLPLNRPFYGRAVTSFQTNGRGYGTRLSVGEGRKHFSYRLSGNFDRVGDRRAPGYNLTNTGAREHTVQGGVKYHKGKWTAQVDYSRIRQNSGILRAAVGSSGAALIRNTEAEIPTFIRSFSYDINEPNQTVTHQTAAASLSRYLKTGKLTLRYAKQFNARQEFDVRRNADLPILDLELETDDVQSEWEHRLGERISGAAGVQYFAQSNRNNPGTLITPFIPNYAVRRISAFITESLETRNGTWELGIRYDAEENTVSGRDSRQAVFRDQFRFNNITASLGHIKPVSKHLTLRNHLGTGWRPPNMAELYSFGQHESQTTFGLLRYTPREEGGIRADRVIPFRESGVRPEQSIKYTADAEWQKNGQLLKVTAYANYIGNFTFSRPIGILGTARGPMPTFILDQADALFLGAELTYTRTFRENGTATLGAGYLWSQNVQRGEPLINQPPAHLRLEVTQSFSEAGPFDKVIFTLSPAYTFTQFQAPRVIPIRALVEGTETVSADDPIFDFAEAPPGYFLLNARVHISKGKFDLSARADNILNVRYKNYLNTMRYFAHELGFNLMLSLTYHF